MILITGASGMMWEGSFAGAAETGKPFKAMYGTGTPKSAGEVEA
jgi:hypothetical protein